VNGRCILIYTKQSVPVEVDPCMERDRPACSVGNLNATTRNRVSTTQRHCGQRDRFLIIFACTQTDNRLQLPRGGIIQIEIRTKLGARIPGRSDSYVPGTIVCHTGTASVGIPEIEYPAAIANTIDVSLNTPACTGFYESHVACPCTRDRQAIVGVCLCIRISTPAEVLYICIECIPIAIDTFTDACQKCKIHPIRRCVNHHSSRLSIPASQRQNDLVIGTNNLFEINCQLTVALRLHDCSFSGNRRSCIQLLSFRIAERKCSLRTSDIDRTTLHHTCCRCDAIGAANRAANGGVDYTLHIACSRNTGKAHITQAAAGYSKGKMVRHLATKC